MNLLYIYIPLTIFDIVHTSCSSGLENAITAGKKYLNTNSNLKMINDRHYKSASQYIIGQENVPKDDINTLMGLYLYCVKENKYSLHFAKNMFKVYKYNPSMDLNTEPSQDEIECSTIFVNLMAQPTISREDINKLILCQTNILKKLNTRINQSNKKLAKASNPQLRDMH